MGDRGKTPATSRRITLEDLKELCNEYVPSESRHASSWDLDLWWPAHELGHLLTVEPEDIGTPYFGLDDRAGKVSARRRHELLCLELAAMHVGRRLLTAAGRPDLATKERSDTDYQTVYYNDRGRVLRILTERDCLRLPRTRVGLELRLQQVTSAYRARQRRRTGRRHLRSAS